MRFGRDALTEGVEAHRIEGETVRVYSVAKTIADTANKIGLHVALEALRGLRASEFRAWFSNQPAGTVCLNKLVEELATVALAQLGAENRCRLRAARGRPESGLALLDKLDRSVRRRAPAKKK